MSYKLSKEFVNELYKAAVDDISTSPELLKLIIEVQQSLETDEERTERLAKFRQMTTVA